jgi:hypothetical protein
MDFLNHREGGFPSGFSPFSFTVYSNCCRKSRGCVSLKKWKSQGKAVEVTLNSKEEEFVWITSKNSASGQDR